MFAIGVFARVQKGGAFRVRDRAVKALTLVLQAGGFGLVGIDIPLAHRWSFFGEGRYRWSEAELGGDFTEKIWALDTKLYRPDPTTVADAE